MSRPAASSLLISLVATMVVIAFSPAGHSQANLPQHRAALPQNPSLPGQVPVTGNPGTVTGGVQNIINSKLLIFTRNGIGTTSTQQSGEFATQLIASAKVNQEFSLQWSRPKAGKTVKASLYLTPFNSAHVIASQSITMPAQSIAINIPFSFPKLEPNTYNLMVVSDSGNSTRVIVHFTGNDSSGQPVIVSQGSSSPPPTTKTPIYITGASFTPMIGAPGAPGYKRARLTLILRTTAATTISNIEVDGLSEPWTNPELLTSSNSKNSPITIFSGKWSAGGGTRKILPDQDNSITVTLRANSKKDVQADEAGPGFYSPGDWGFAFGQTATASFRWTVNGVAGTISGSFEQSPKKPWQWGNP